MVMGYKGGISTHVCNMANWGGHFTHPYLLYIFVVPHSNLLTTSKHTCYCEQGALPAIILLCMSAMPALSVSLHRQWTFGLIPHHQPKGGATEPLDSVGWEGLSPLQGARNLMNSAMLESLNKP